MLFRSGGKRRKRTYHHAPNDQIEGVKLGESYLKHSCCICQSLNQFPSKLDNKRYLYNCTFDLTIARKYVKLSSSLDVMLCASVMHCGLGRLSEQISAAMDIQEQRHQEEEDREEIKMEWQLCALIIDRFLLWIFILATISSTFSILYMSPHTQLFAF